MGSTFKVVDSIAALENGVISPTTTLEAGATYTNHGLLWHDWNPDGHGAIDLTQAIVQSADSTSTSRLRLLPAPGQGLEDWAKHLGLGHPTGIDLPGEVGGLVPTPDWKHAAYTKKTDPKGWQIDRLWKPGDSINLAIGQGNLETTPMQAAVTYAAIANGGYLVTPHVGVKIVDAQGKLVRRLPYTQPRSLGISQETIGVVQNALHEAATTPNGTSYPVVRRLHGASGRQDRHRPGRGAERLRLVCELRAGQRPQVRGGRHDPAGWPRRRQRRAGRPHDLRLAVPRLGGPGATGSAHSD